MPKGAGIAIGIAVGVALGTALDNVALGIAIGLALGAGWDMQNPRSIFCEKDKRESSAEKNPVNDARNAEREAHVAAVMAEAQKRGTITNHEVQALLGVSDATAERYLQELESEGKLAQVGKTGNAVSYRVV